MMENRIEPITKRFFKRLLWCVTVLSYVGIFYLSSWLGNKANIDSFFVVLIFIVGIFAWLGICFGMNKLLYGKWNNIG
jgi:hypothetical protein